MRKTSIKLIRIALLIVCLMIGLHVATNAGATTNPKPEININIDAKTKDVDQFYNVDLTSCISIKSLKTKTSVRVEGSIARHLHDDIYLFESNGCGIQVKIESKYWTGLSISDKDTVRIAGDYIPSSTPYLIVKEMYIVIDIGHQL